MSESNRKVCRRCLKKQPPIETELKEGTNISSGRWNRKDYICDECYKEQAKEYRDGGKEKFSEYLKQLHHETVDELAAQWEDPAYKRLSPSERVYKVWDKGERYDPSMGVRKKWALEVVMPDLWFIDPNGVVEYFFERANWSRTRRASTKGDLIEFASFFREMLQNGFRVLAENRWDGLVQSIAKNHEGRAKMVATPAHIDPLTKENVDNWFLLSREEDQKRREDRRIEIASHFDEISQEERGIVQVRKEEEVKKQKKHEGNPEDQSESRKNNDSKGGDSE